MIYPELFDANDPEMVEALRGLTGSGVTLKSALIEWAGVKRGLGCSRLSNNTIILDNNLIFNNMNGPTQSAAGEYMCNKKDIARIMLKDMGCSVADSALFKSDEIEAACHYAQHIGYPAVLKPRDSARGRGVTTHINSDECLRKSWDRASAGGRSVIVERHVHGEDYRFFVVNRRVISVTARVRAHVVGDGTSTVLSLIKEKNKQRRRNLYLRNCLIPENADELDYLSTTGLSLDSSPHCGQRVVLRGASNLSAGGDSIDVTDSVHDSFVKQAIRIVENIPGLDYVGIDIIATDISRMAVPDDHVVGELEFSPAPLSHFPVEGKPRDMAGAILDSCLNEKVVGVVPQRKPCWMQQKARPVAKRLLISGKVQCVGYRKWIKSEARRNNLSGWVRNRADGRVECVLSGDVQNVSRVLMGISEGPLQANVFHIAMVDYDGKPVQGFRIRKDYRPRKRTPWVLFARLFRNYFSDRVSH